MTYISAVTIHLKKPWLVWWRLTHCLPRVRFFDQGSSTTETLLSYVVSCLRNHLHHRENQLSNRLQFYKLGSCMPKRLCLSWITPTKLTDSKFILILLDGLLCIAANCWLKLPHKQTVCTRQEMVWSKITISNYNNRTSTAALRGIYPDLSLGYITIISSLNKTDTPKVSPMADLQHVLHLVREGLCKAFGSRKFPLPDVKS